MLKKWTLISKTDISPSPWFPLENRVYQLPNGNIIDNFTVTTLADVSLIIPITPDNKVIMARQYKPGADDIMLQFPGGRIDHNHTNLDSLATAELEEELGIKVEQNQLTQFGRFSGFSTKATEIVYFYLATNCEFNSQPHFDANEEIEPVALSFKEIDQKIASNEIYCAPTIAGWTLAKQKFAEIFQNQV
jgi:ADP-ribose pyrophosphatase